MYPWVMGVQICWNELPCLFPREDIHWQILKIFFLRTTGLMTTKLGTKHPWLTGIHICMNEGPCPFCKGDNNEIAKIHWQTLKILFSRINCLISTKLSTKLSWVMGIQVYSNKRTHPFPRGDKEIVKIHLETLKIFLLSTTGSISTKLGTKHPWVMGIQFFSNEGPRPFPRGDNYEIVKMYWQTFKVIF